jgi:exonuclease SbcC
MKNSKGIVMLEKIKLDNFVSHRSTTLKLDRGVTIFIGRNGSGKSSVIDAITFALYGQHARGHNKNLVRRGSEGSMVQLTLRVDSNRYQATRYLDAKGSLSGAKLEQLTDTGLVTLAHGERKQMGEAMSTETSSIIGLDYDRLRVAAVVQQGELDAILRRKPSEFKELINTLVGIDRLDRAFQNMRDVLDLFKSLLRNRIGYDYNDIANLEQRMEQERKNEEESSRELVKLNSEMQKFKEEEKNKREKLEELEPLSRKVKELDEKKALLTRYIENKIAELRATLIQELAKMEKQQSDLKKDIDRIQKLSADAKKNLEQVSVSTIAESEHKRLGMQLSSLEQELQDCEGKIGRLKGLVDHANTIEPKEAKCPVCGSLVGKITVELDLKHIKVELRKIEEMKKDKNLQMKKLTRQKETLIGEQALAKKAFEFLSSYGIKSMDDLAELTREIEEKRAEFSKLPGHIEYIHEQLANIPAHIDDASNLSDFTNDKYSKELERKILDLEKELKVFKQEEFEDLKFKYDELVRIQIPSLARQIGKFVEINEKARKEIENLTEILEEIKKANVYADLLEKIRKGVYNRDGSVAMSLRSWALKMISQKASDYIVMFGLNVLRVELAEKARDVLITCYGPRGTTDMESLSGGEKVAIALALRFGMAYVMGHGKLDFIILDEPTTHLDEERRKSLVRIITEAFRSGLGPLSQMILITHDSEIFENAEVDSVYKFVMTNEGTRVSRV